MPQFTPPLAANERIDSCFRRNGLLVYGRLWADCGFGAAIVAAIAARRFLLPQEWSAGNAKESPKYTADCPPPPTIARRTTTNAKIIHTLSFPGRPFLRRQESQVQRRQRRVNYAAARRPQCQNTPTHFRSPTDHSCEGRNLTNMGGNAA